MTTTPPQPQAMALRRFLLKLSVEDAAKRIRAEGVKCSATTYWRWEADLRPPPRNAWGAIARALRTTVTDLRVVRTP